VIQASTCGNRAGGLAPEPRVLFAAGRLFTSLCSRSDAADRFRELSNPRRSSAAGRAATLLRVFIDFAPCNKLPYGCAKYRPPQGKDLEQCFFYKARPNSLLSSCEQCAPPNQRVMDP